MQIDRTRPALMREPHLVAIALAASLATLGPASGVARAQPGGQEQAAVGAAGRRTVVAGQYPAGGFKRAMLGSGYRELWATPISVEVLDLKTEAGGLTPVVRVGGQQTKGLALAGADGRSYTFRGLEKDASHLLDAIDPELKDSLVADLLNDLMSAQHPASELVARGLLDAAGIPCPPWRIVTLPDDPALGRFQEDFAGAIGVFAPYPQPATDGRPGFLGATQIIDHLELYQRLEAGTDTADSRALLKARLVDILMGDWDRHRKQWRWAKLPDKVAWTPIPEDRDQAFSRYEGFIPSRVRRADPRFQSFGPKYPDIRGLTSNGSEQDRLLLVGLSREDFLGTAQALKQQVTDAVIESAARLMPPEWYAQDGPRLTSALRARRDALPEIAAKYYENLAQRVDVYLTARDEQVDAKRLAGGDLEVSVRVVGPGHPVEAPVFHRVFLRKETEEVRIYAQAGNDTVRVTGGGSGPRVRVIGGAGNDTLDATAAGGAKLSDSQGDNRSIEAPLDDHPYKKPPPPRNAPWIPPRDFGGQKLGVPVVSYGSDLGVFLGYGYSFQSYGFRKSPFANLQVVNGGWSFAQEAGRIGYSGEYHRENRRSFFGMYAYASGVEVLRYYGSGNEIEAPEDQTFYKAYATQYLLYPTYKLPFAKHGLFTLGPVAKYTQERRTDDPTYVATVEPYGFGDFGELGVHGVLSWDGRDSAVFPRRGVFAAARASYVFEAWDVEEDFGQVNGNLNAYVPLGGHLTLAARVGGKKVFGKYPYFEGAALGQGGLGAVALEEPGNTLRGHRSRRYLGDSSVYANADVRLQISRMNIILPGTWGIVGFGDVGRVWLEGESSDTWHTSFGGGLWVSYLANRVAFSVGYAQGEDESLIYFGAGFGF